MTHKIKTLIVDDEALARKGLAIRLQDYAELDVVGMCSTGQQAIDYVKNNSVDLIFLDIQMPGVNGFEVIEQLAALQIKMPSVIFVTAFDQFAVKAFENNALDYLLKPMDDERLKRAVEKATRFYTVRDDVAHKQKLAQFVASVTGKNCEEILSRLASGESLENAQQFPQHIAIKDQGEILRLSVADIQWVDAAGDYMCLHCCDGKTHILRKTMKELESELDPELFVRVHRSAIVNTNQIQKLVTQVSGEYLLILDTGQELKVSRSYRDKVKAAIAN